jgi:hypothetical protein
MSQETTTPANKDVCVLSEEEIDAVSGGYRSNLWNAVLCGAVAAIVHQAAPDVVLTEKHFCVD